MNWKVVLILTPFVVLTIFIAQNFKIVEIQFLFWTFKASRALVLLATLLMGFLMGWATGLLGKKKDRDL